MKKKNNYKCGDIVVIDGAIVFIRDIGDDGEVYFFAYIDPSRHKLDDFSSEVYDFDIDEKCFYGTIKDISRYANKSEEEILINYINS